MESFSGTQAPLNTTVRAVIYSVDRMLTKRKTEIAERTSRFCGQTVRTRRMDLRYRGGVNSGFVRGTGGVRDFLPCGGCSKVDDEVHNGPWPYERLGGAEGCYRNSVWASSAEAILS